MLQWLWGSIMLTNYTVLPAFDTADVSFPFYYSPRPNLFEFISDSKLSLLAPVVAYVSQHFLRTRVELPR